MSDPYYNNVSLLLPMFGDNNGTTFTDYSPTSKTITRYGDTKTVTAESKYYGSSGYFDGSLDYLVASGGDLDLGSDSFTVEFWLRVSGFSNLHGVFFIGNPGLNSNRIQSDILSTGEIGFFAGSSSTSWSIRAGSAMSVDTWHHIALVRDGATARIFLDGVGEETSISNEPAAGSDMRIGFARTSSTYRWLDGWMQDFRVTKGVARYTADFTPPTKLIGNISGTITGDTGTPCERSIVAFPRVYPQRIATTTSAADGTYSLTNLPVTDHSRIVLDDDGGTLYNDLIDRVIPG
jgi:hypothetical protein